MSEEMSNKIKSSEQSLEEERENLMLELKRGKSAALGLMQVCVFLIYVLNMSSYVWLRLTFWPP